MELVLKMNKLNEHFRMAIMRFLENLEQQSINGKTNWKEGEIKDLMLKSLIDEEAFKED